MKSILLSIGMVVVVSIIPFKQVKAQDAISLIIKEGIKKVIKAVDLKIQRLQNETIWLQNAQKVVENTMSQFKLEEIAGWVEKQRALYKDYFDELWRVKNAIAYYHRIREVIERQLRLVEDYKKAWQLLKQDVHFTADEYIYMRKVYGGILNESAKCMDELFLVINSFATQMSDARRLDIINGVADQVEANHSDLRTFNEQNILLSIQRSRSKDEVEFVKHLYGLK